MKKVFLTFTLAFSTVFVSAQISWDTLPGPFGLKDMYGNVEDYNGLVHILMDKKIFTSTDQGDSWEETFDTDSGLIGAFIPCIDKRTYYFYRSDTFTGFRYFDASTKTWVPYPIPANAILFDCDKNGRYYAVTKSLEVYYSDGFGTPFHKLQNVAFPKPYLSEFVALDAKNIVVGFSDFNGNSYLYHFDTTGVFQALSVPFSGDILYNKVTGSLFISHSYFNGFTTKGFIEKSTDGGLTWQTKSIPGNPVLSTAEIGESGAIYGYNDGHTYLSNDDGESWTTNAPSNFNQSHDVGLFTGNWYTRKQCEWPEFGRSTDRGETWTDLVNNIAYLKPRVDKIVVGKNGILYAETCKRGFEYSADEGFSWKELVIDSPSIYARDLLAAYDGTLYAISTQFNIYNSFDGGQNWHKLNLDTLVPFFTGFQGMSVDHSNRIYLFTMNDMFRSDDVSGTSWKKLKSFAFNYAAPNVSFNESGYMYFCHYLNNHNYRYDPISDNFFYMPLNTLSSSGGYTYSLHATKQGEIYATGDKNQGNLIHNKIFKYNSTNGNFDELPVTYEGVPYLLSSSGYGHLFLSTNLGNGHGNIYKSIDGGMSWELLYTVDNQSSNIYVPSSLNVAYDGRLYLTDSHNLPVRTSEKFNSPATHSKDQVINANIAVFPNPVQDKFSVRFENTSLQKGARIRIFNTLGMEEMSKELISDDIELDVRALPIGMYYYAISNNEVYLTGGKILKIE